MNFLLLGGVICKAMGLLMRGVSGTHLLLCRVPRELLDAPRMRASARSTGIAQARNLITQARKLRPTQRLGPHGTHRYCSAREG